MLNQPVYLNAFVFLVECENGFQESYLFMKSFVAVTCFNFYYTLSFTTYPQDLMKRGRLRNWGSSLFGRRSAPNQNPAHVFVSVSVVLVDGFGGFFLS